MPTVSGLTIKKQTGTYYATWAFSGQGKATTSSSGAVKAGNLVSIKSEATKYYNGVAIPAWVKKEKWYVTQVKGDRAVLGKCQKGDHNIQSANIDFHQFLHHLRLLQLHLVVKTNSTFTESHGITIPVILYGLKPVRLK